jgi:hypothetical protein
MFFNISQMYWLVYSLIMNETKAVIKLLLICSVLLISRTFKSSVIIIIPGKWKEGHYCKMEL